MNEFIQSLLIGAVIGLVIVPIILWIYTLIRNTRERRRVKRMIKTGNFLSPLDPKDYNTDIWQSNIDVESNKRQLENINNLFKKQEIKNG